MTSNIADIISACIDKQKLELDNQENLNNSYSKIDISDKIIEKRIFSMADINNLPFINDTDFTSLKYTDKIKIPKIKFTNNPTDIQRAFEDRVKIDTGMIYSIEKKEIIKTDENKIEVLFTDCFGNTSRRMANLDTDLYDITTIKDKNNNIIQEIVTYPTWHDKSESLIEVRTFLDENTVVGIEYDKEEHIHSYYERSRELSDYKGYITDLYRYNTYGFLTDMCQVYKNNGNTIVKTLRKHEYRVINVQENKFEKEIFYNCLKNKKTKFYFDGHKRKKLYTINLTKNEIKTIQNIKNPPSTKDITSISFKKICDQTTAKARYNNLTKNISNNITNDFNIQKNKCSSDLEQNNSRIFNFVPKTLNVNQDLIEMLCSYGEQLKNLQNFANYENIIRDNFRTVIELLNSKENDYYIYNEKQVLNILKLSLNNSDFLDVITHKNKNGNFSVRYSTSLGMDFVILCSNYKYQILKSFDENVTSLNQIMQKILTNKSEINLPNSINSYNFVYSDLKQQTLEGKPRFSEKEIKTILDLYIKYDTTIANKKSILDDLLHFGQDEGQTFSYEEIGYMLSLTSAHIKEEQLNLFKLFKALKNEGIKNIVHYLKNKNSIYLSKTASRCKDPLTLAKIFIEIGFEYASLKTPNLLIDIYQLSKHNTDLVYDFVLTYKENEIRKILNYIVKNNIQTENYKKYQFRYKGNSLTCDINTRRTEILEYLNIDKDIIFSDIKIKTKI